MTVTLVRHKEVETGDNLIACTEHIDVNRDMFCDICGYDIPFTDFLERKSVEAVASDSTVVKVTGNMPDDTLLESVALNKEEAINMAQSYLPEISSDDVVAAYDISMVSNTIEYQPGDFNQVVKVNISNLDLKFDEKGASLPSNGASSSKELALLHIIDDDNYEILPLSKINGNELEFKATRFSPYILIYVDTYTITFSGDKNFDVLTTEGTTVISGDVFDETRVVDGVTIPAGTNFNFVITPKDGYGITDVVLVDATTDASGDNYLVLSGGVIGRTGKINKVSQDLVIEVSTAVAPIITAQPDTTKAIVGNTAEFSVSAEDATTFTWQYRQDGNDYWKDMTNSFGTSVLNGNTSTLTTVPVTYSMTGYEFRCLIGDDNFTGDERVKSNVAILVVTQQPAMTGETPVVLSQPQSQKVLGGEIASFEVTAIGTNLTFTWQYRENEDDYWKAATAIGSSKEEDVGTDGITKKSTFTTKATTYEMTGYDIRCVVGNDFYNGDLGVKSNIVNLIVTNNGDAKDVKFLDLQFLSDIKSQKVKLGDTVTFTVETKSADTFRWQYKATSGDGYWLDVSDGLVADYTTSISTDSEANLATGTLNIDTSKMAFSGDEVINNLSGFEFRCIISNSAVPTFEKTSNVAFLVVTQDVLSINVEYEMPTVNLTASNAESDSEITVSWDMLENTVYSLYYNNANGTRTLLADNVTSPYIHRGLTYNQTYNYTIVATSTLDATYTKEESATGSTTQLPTHEITFNGYENIRIFDAYGNERIDGKMYALDGLDFEFRIVPKKGYGLSTITLVDGPTDPTAANYMEATGYVLGKSGKMNTVNQEWTIDVQTILAPNVITPPETTKAEYGQSVELITVAENTSKFIWQYQVPGTNYWQDATTLGTVVNTDVDATTKQSTLTIAKATYKINGYKFRCTVENSYFADNGVKSDIALMLITDNRAVKNVKYLPLVITQNPVSQKVKFGDIVTFNVYAEGADTYEWQYRTDDSSEWQKVDNTIGEGFNSSALVIDTNDMLFDNKTLEILNNLSGYRFRCVMTSNDAPNYKKASDDAFLSVAMDTLYYDVKFDSPKVNLQAGSGDKSTSIPLTWDVQDGIKYQVYYVDENGVITLLSNDAQSPYEHVGLTRNTTYEYLVIGYDPTDASYRATDSAIGSTAYDDIYDRVTKDTTKPVLDNPNITPDSGKISPTSEVELTFNFTDENYDELGGSLLYPDEIAVLVNGIEATTAEKTLSKASIPNGERFTLKVKNIWGSGILSFKIPAGAITDLAKNSNDEYIIETELTVVRTLINPVTNFNATSGESDKSITLTWNDSMNNEGLTYILEVSSGENSWVVLNPDAESPTVHSGLNKNMSFEYRIKAVSEIGEESPYVYTIGRTKHDPNYGDVMIDTIHPVIELVKVIADNVYINNTAEIVAIFESSDENYYKTMTNLTENKFIIEPLNAASGDAVRSLTVEDTPSGERFILTLSNISGTGPLVLGVPAGVIIDAALNPNEVTEFETEIYVINGNPITDDAPTLSYVADDIHSIMASNNQISRIPIAQIVYEYRLSGDGDFIVVDDTTLTDVIISNLYSNTDYEVRTKVTDVANNSRTSQSAFITTKKIDASAIQITHETEDWTNLEDPNPKVVATIYWNDTKYTHQYSINNVDWLTADGLTTDINIEENLIVYARYFDGRGYSDSVEHEIKNIDKIKPFIGKVIIPSGEANSKTVTVTDLTDEGGSGIKGYCVNTEDNFDDVTWTPINGNEFEFVANENRMYFIRIIDNAGNVSTTATANVTDIVPRVTSVEFQEELELDVFETKIPTLTYDGKPKEIRYTIEDETIVSINNETREVTGKASGETIITVIVVNYDGTEVTDTCRVKVYAIDPTITIDKNVLDFIYGDTPKTINITECITSGDLSITTENDKVATATVENRVITVTPTGAGTTTLTLKSEETPQYLSKEIEITVNVSKRVIEVSWSGDSFEYDGKEKEVTAIINNIVNGDSIDITYSGNKETDAGNYTAEITAVSNENYTIDGADNLTHAWEITRADRTLDLIKELIVTYGIPGHIEFTYDGEDVTAIIESGDGTIITATYQDGIKSGDITVIPVKAGVQIVKVTVPESKNYNSIEGTVNVIVKRAFGEIAVDEPNITLTYGDAPKDIEYKYSGDGDVTVESSDENKATVTIDEENKIITVTPVKAGEVTITINASQTDKYDAGEVKIKVTINPRPIKATWSGDKFTYDGKVKQVTANITNLVGDDSVSITYSGDKATDAGNYIAEIIGINNANYIITNGENLTHNWEIERADINPIITMEDYVYGGVMTEPQITGNSGDGDVTYYYYASGDDISTAKEWSTVTDSFTLEPGVYVMYADVVISKNYNAARSNEVEFFVIIGDMSIILTENGEPYDSDWTNNDILATIIIPDDVRGMTAMHYRFEGDDTLYIEPATSHTVEITFADNINSKVYFTAVNVEGRPVTMESAGYILKIDKTKPSIGSISVPSGKANTKDITVSNITDEGGSGIAGYYVTTNTNTEGATWVPFSGDTFTYTVSENDRYYAFVIDNAGNISEVTANSQIEVTDIVEKITDIEHDAIIEVTVFETVTPNITYSGEPKEIIYEIINTDYATVDENGNVTGKASGDTTLKVTFIDYDGETTTIEIPVKVLLATPTLTLGSAFESFVYGDQNRDITFTYTGDGEVSGDSSDRNVVKVDNIINEPSNKIITLNPEKVGEATITITTSETIHYESVTRTMNVKVTPRIIEVSWGEDTFTYDGNVKEITAEITNLVSGDSVVINYSGNKESNAGKYTASIIGVDNPNYTIEGATNLSKDWVINKADRPVIVMPTTQTVTYGDEPTITFTYSGEDTTATVTSNNKNVADVNTYTDENKSGTILVKTEGAGTAKFVVIVPETANYKEGSGEATVIVEKNSSADIEIIDPPAEITYGDDPVEVEINYPGNGNVTAESGSGDIVSVNVSGDTIIITPEGVGETTITVKAEETDQYTEEEVTITIRVNPKPVILSWDYTVPFVYDKTEHKVTATITNKETGDKVNVIDYENNAKTNAGTYNAKALTLDNPNYTLDGAVNNLCTWVIEKAEREITMPDLLNIIFGNDGKIEFTYTGEDVDAEVTIDSENYMKIKSFVDGLNSGDITIETIGRGTSTVTVVVPASDNYKDATKTCEVTVISADGGLVVNQPEITLTYGGESGKVTYDYFGNGNVSGDSSDRTIAIVDIDEENKEIIIIPVNAGETTITIKTEATAQYDAGEATIKVKVNPKPVKLEWDEEEFIYDGTEKVVTATVTNKVGNDSVNVIKYTNDSNKATKANEAGYIAIAEELDNPNYTLESGENISHKWYIMKADRELALSQNSITLEYGTNGTITYWYSGDIAPDSVISVISNAGNIANVENVISEKGGTITVIPVAVGVTKGIVTIEETENYNAVSKEFEIIINRNTTEKVRVDDANKNIEFTYGDPSKNINYYYNGNGEITVTSSNENSVTVGHRSGDKTIVITPRNAGTSTITITAAQTNQYEASSVVINVTVKQKIVELNWIGKTFVYDGTPKKVTATVTNAINGEAVEVTNYINNVNTLVGKYTAVAGILNDSNYTLNGSTTAKHEWEIVKAELHPNIEMEDYIYGGEKKGPTVTGNDGNGNETIYVYAESDDETKAINWELVNSSIYLKPGKYKMYATIDATDNYKEAKTNTVEFEITILDITVELTENGNPYEGNWTNNDVVAKITVPNEVTTMTSVYYKIDGKTELINYDMVEKDENVVTITFNKNINETIKFVAVNVAGKPVTNESQPYILKIDKSKPVIGKIEVIPTNEELANSKLISVSNIADVFESGIAAYCVNTVNNTNGVTWVPFSGDNFKYEVSENDTYYVFVKDSAGNISETTANSTITVENIVDRVSDATIDSELIVEVNHTISVATSLKYSGEPKEIIYEIEDETYASINSVTGTITGKASGDTKVIVTLKDYDGTTTILEAKLKVLATDPNLTINEPTELIFIYGDASGETTFNYDGNGEILVKSNNEGVAKVEKVGNRIIVTPGIAGEAVITVSSTETAQYIAAEKTIPVKVNPRPVILTWSGDTFTYDGKTKEVTAKITNLVSGDTVNITYTDNSKIDAGNYTAIAESVDNPNYTVEGGTNITHNWIIKKAKRPIEMIDEITVEFGSTEEVIFTYSGEDTNEINVSTAIDIAEAQYEDGNNGGKITVIPVGAGTCNMIVTIGETKNYEVTIAVCKVTVLATDAELNVVDNLRFVYGDAPVTETFTYTGNSTNIIASTSDDKIVKATITGNQIIITPLDAGTAQITITAASTSQYNAVSATINVTVDKRPIEVIWGIDEFVYDRTNKIITIDRIDNLVGADFVNVTYSGNVEMNAGNYVAEIIAVDDPNYTIEGGKDITHNWVIKKADRVISVQDVFTLKYGETSDVTFTYNGEDVTANVTNQDDSVASITYVDGSKEGTITVTGNKQGESIVTINVPESDNYNAEEDTFVIKVELATPELIPDKTDLIYTYGDYDDVIGFTYTGDGKVDVITSDSNVVTATVVGNELTINPGSVGTAVLTLISTATDHYESVISTINVTVKPRPVHLNWGETILVYTGTPKTVTAIVENVVAGDLVEVTAYEGNTATEIGEYRAKATALSNDNYTLVGGVNVETDWLIKELLPPQIIVKQGGTIIDSGKWASGDVTITVEFVEVTGIEVGYEYSFNGKDWREYTGTLAYTTETQSQMFYAKAYNKANGIPVSLSGEHELKIDKVDPVVKINSIQTDETVKGYINDDSVVTIDLEVIDLTSGIDMNQFIKDNIKILTTYKGEQKELKSIIKDLTPVSNQNGSYKYTLILKNITEDGALSIYIPEKSIYDRAGRFNRSNTLSLGLTADNKGPNVGRIDASTDEYGRVHGSTVDLDVTASDESGISDYEWQVSIDGKKWETFITDETSEEISEVIFDKVKEDGVHHFRVIVTDKLGNSSTSKTESVNIIRTMDRKPTIRFESQQTSSKEVTIIAIVKTTRKLTSIKVGAREINKSDWVEVKTNNEITVTTTHKATTNGIYEWTVVDDKGNVVTEEFNVTTIVEDPNALVVTHKSYSLTEYTRARIEFTANKDAKITKVILNATTTDITTKTSFEGITFSTINYTRKITAEISNEITFTPGTVFVFADKAGNTFELTVNDLIETKIMYVRTVSAGTKLFNELFGADFDENDAKTIVNQMESKAKEINGSVKPYYGLSSNLVDLEVTKREDFETVDKLSSATKTSGKALRFNKYGETEVLEATIEQNVDGTNIRYQNNNITGVRNLETEGTINYDSGAEYQTFRITIRAK